LTLLGAEAGAAVREDDGLEVCVMHLSDYSGSEGLSVASGRRSRDFETYRVREDVQPILQDRDRRGGRQKDRTNRSNGGR
jgi:hypothetical protein